MLAKIAAKNTFSRKIGKFQKQIYKTRPISNRSGKVWLGSSGKLNFWLSIVIGLTGDVLKTFFYKNNTRVVFVGARPEHQNVDPPGYRELPGDQQTTTSCTHCRVSATTRPAVGRDVLAHFLPFEGGSLNISYAKRATIEVNPLFSGGLSIWELKTSPKN